MDYAADMMITIWRSSDDWIRKIANNINMVMNLLKNIV